jgi:hypothetical protein
MTARKGIKAGKLLARSNQPAAADLDDDFPEEVGADIEQFFADQDESAIVMVYKIGKPGERDGFLDTHSISSLRNPSAQQVIRDTYGAGNYNLKLKAPDSRGIMRFSGSKTITIAERPGGASPAVNGRPHSVEDFFREEAAKTQQLLLAMIASNKPQQLDFAGIAALISAMNGGANKQTDLGAVVQAFTLLKQSADPNQLGQVKDVLEIAKSLSGAGAAPAAGDGELDTSWAGIIKGVLSAFGGAAAGGRRALNPAPATLPAGGGDDDDDGQPGEEEMFQAWLKGQLQFLKTKAANNKPVEFWIQYTIDNADEAGNQAMFAALKGGATFENLLQFDPEIATNAALRVWFQKFYDGLKRSLQPPATIPWIVRNPTDVADHEVGGADRQPKAGDPPNGGNPGQP